MSRTDEFFLMTAESLAGVKHKGLASDGKNERIRRCCRFRVFGRGQPVKVSPEGHGSINAALDLTELGPYRGYISVPCQTQNHTWWQHDDEAASSKHTPVLLLW